MIALFAAASAERLDSVCGQDPGWVCRQLLDHTGNDTVAEIGDWLAGPLARILVIVALAFIAARLARRFVSHAVRGMTSGGRQINELRRRAPDALVDTPEENLRAEQRTQALSGVLRSVVSFTVFTIAAFMILGELGIDLAPLLAGAGILGIALGFGSQTLIKDFLSGLFIIIEDQFGVGDIVDLEGTRGTVEVVSLRTTRLRAVDGTVWTVPNGEVRFVGNMSKHWSRALLDIVVGYGTSIDKARQVIKRVADELWHEDPHILEEPEVWGVESLGSAGVTIRLVIKTTPSEQYGISRVLRERIKDAFDAEGIEMPFPQQAFWPPAEPPAKRGRSHP